MTSALGFGAMIVVHGREKLHIRIGTLLVLAGISVACTVEPPKNPTASVAIRTLSSRPDTVTGGDALVEVDGAPQGARLLLNDRDVTDLLNVDQSGRARGLIAGMQPGRNTLAVTTGDGQAAELQVTNRDATEPFLSGLKIKPFTCMTNEAGLGPATNEDCYAPPRYDYFYKPTTGAFRPLMSGQPRPADLATTRTIEGVEAPFIVRVESGVVGRHIYRIAVLDPDGWEKPVDQRHMATTAWNRRLVVAFGGGCGAHYTQGADTIQHALSELELGRGFAYAVSPSLINQQFCNPSLQAEALSLIKEHFVEHYGVPQWTAGSGASGGSIQQYVIAEMFPGLLDGLQPAASYPDSQNQAPTDCLLLSRVFASEPGRWTPEKRVAVQGITENSCVDWAASFGRTVKAVPIVTQQLISTVGGIRIPSPNPCGVEDPSTLFSASNPNGLRCSRFDFLGEDLGRDAKGLALSPADNVGVQYGLTALAKGLITIDDFIALNERVGGFDRDGEFTATRTTGDIGAIQRLHRIGLLNSFANINEVPVVVQRSYADTAPIGTMGAIHDRTQDFIIRARMERAASGKPTSQVLLTSGPERGDEVHVIALDILTEWLDALAADSEAPSLERTQRARPKSAADTCWGPGGEEIVEPAEFASASACNKWYPVYPQPRMVAGGPLTSDVVKCSLRDVQPTDYPGASDAQLMRIRATFPSGVCDYAVAGQGYEPFGGPFSRLAQTR